jgi:Holliday junction resolvasome RuvABC endonuclease subunit
MLPKLINIKNAEIKRLDDEYDAIAVAITCSVTFLSTEKVF